MTYHVERAPEEFLSVLRRDIPEEEWVKVSEHATEEEANLAAVPVSTQFPVRIVFVEPSPFDDDELQEIEED
jgi:hypothetical protein